MIPSVLSNQIRNGIEDFLKTTFPVSTPFFHGIIDRLLEKDGELFRGPYISVKLPFQTGSIEPDFFRSIPLSFAPYLHQVNAFKRIGGDTPQSTIVATGTGSGKTECFIYPILDYCYLHRGEQGIKAIIIYPMNALATDQAKRIARQIHNNSNLRNQVIAGLFIGQSDDNAAMVMTEESVITNKDTLRLKPPDILLTNYKMLDYLLIRPKDYPLWKENNPEALRYLVVDELHTFDGAQGTDLACLIRRLKERLKTPAGHLCCVGTSATLGGNEDIGELIKYASDVFGETFEEEAFITEALLSPAEFLSGHEITGNSIVSLESIEKLGPYSYPDCQSYIKAQHELWFGEKIETFEEDVWKVALGESLKGHAFFRDLMMILDSKTTSIEDLLYEISKTWPEVSQIGHQSQIYLINSLLALISCARIKEGERLLPFLHVRVQLWLREMRRIVAEVSVNPDLRFFDDLKEDQISKHLPILHCRECGSMGWGGTMRQLDNAITPDLQTFYNSFFNYSPTITFIFPRDDIRHTSAQEEFKRYICGHCLHLSDGEKITACPSCGAGDKLVSVFVDNRRINQGNRVRGSHDCPFCEGRDSMTIVGSRAASLTSVMISQLFSSPFNEDKKLLAFSDSVQDASHRASFFSARTYRFNFRAALQHYLESQGIDLPLTSVYSGFVSYWGGKMTAHEFIATFLPPDMAWLEGYEYLVENGKLAEGSDIKDQLNKRIDWEILSEYSFTCRIGRTLEKTGSSIACPDNDLIRKAADDLILILSNELGGLKTVDTLSIERFIRGLLTQLKIKGGVFHPALDLYIKDFGGYYVINKIPYMPSFGKHSRTPVFLTSKRGTRFDPLPGAGDSSRTWYEEWVSKSFVNFCPNIGQYAGDIYKFVLPGLVKAGILAETKVKGYSVWGITSSALHISLEVQHYHCDTCGHALSSSASEADFWAGNNCMRFRCTGHYIKDEPKDDYYARLYSRGDVKRLFTGEHTGLLKRKDREELERHFIHNDNPWDPNLLSCTPTLEMGIDIGDLSSVFLCSVPPSVASHIQRYGRSGRRDGNAFNATIANAKPHDLYFFNNPEEMIAGKISPPGCFLNAPAVLERQFTAFCFDRWVESGISSSAIPAKLGQVLGNLGAKGKKNIFPHNFIDFIDTNRTTIFSRFIGMFSEVISDKSLESLQIYVEGTPGDQDDLRYKIINGLASVLKEREALQKKVKKLTELIKKKEADPVKDANYASEMDELKREKSGLNSIIQSINEKDTFNFFTDEGFLPNYSFPESGVILRSIIYRKKSKPDEKGSYETTLYEYERPAISAIHELAPSNRFYAEGRKVVIDQVDMNLSEIEEWQFCNSCPHSENISVNEQKASCPTCGSTLWADAGQRRKMLRMRQVIATTSDKNSRSGDDSDDREPEFYNKHMLVDVEERYQEIAYKINDDTLPFGFEYLSKATFSEINFGKKDNQGETINIAGQEIPKHGFGICMDCGKVQTDDEIKHAITCKHRKSTNQKNIMDFLYLYREYKSEAIRILLPLASFAGSTRQLHSLIAAIFLGLREHFLGNIDHIRSAIYEEPVPEAPIRRQYLVLYDAVPGGTGYLKELMIAEKPLMDVFEKSLDILKACTCGKDPAKDGCYSCLYAYRNSYDMADISRETAIRLLSDIVSRKDLLIVTDSLKKIKIGVLFDSELEARFIEALRRSKYKGEATLMKNDIVNAKPGWYFKINDIGYYIEPQVDLGSGDGVSIPSRPDFVFYPERSTVGTGKPIAVFTDGFMFHAYGDINNRIGKDMAQRMAIVRSGKFSVWSLSWNDIDDKFTPQHGHYENFTADNTPMLARMLDAYDDKFKVKKMSGLHGKDGFDLFIEYLAQPDRNMWKMYSIILAMVLLDARQALARNGIDVVAERLMKDVAWEAVTSATLPLESGDCLAGFLKKDYDEMHPMLRLLIHIEAGALKNQRFDKYHVVCRFFDDDDMADKKEFKAAWNGFIRLFNLYQFIHNAAFITSKGITNGEYAGFTFECATEIRPDETFVSDELEELLSITDPSEHLLLRKIAEQKIPLPEAGYEYLGKDNIIIAGSELAWPDKKIAFLSEDELEFEEIFQSAGWRTAHLKDAIAEPDKYISLIKV